MPGSRRTCETRLAVCALALVVAYGGNRADVPPQSMVREKIGPAGGNVTAPKGTPIADSRITLPAGALEGEVEVAVFSAPDQCPNLPAGRIDISPSVDFLPIAVAFAKPATLRVALPASHVPFFARHDGPVPSRALVQRAALWAVGDSGWEEIPVARRSETWLEASVPMVVHGCFVAVVNVDDADP